MGETFMQNSRLMNIKLIDLKSLRKGGPRGRDSDEEEVVEEAEGEEGEEGQRREEEEDEEKWRE
jgi:hypothetical protein